MGVCPECKTDNPDDAPFCSSCGYRLRNITRLAADTIPEGHPAVPKPPRPSTLEEATPSVVLEQEERAQTFGISALLILGVATLGAAAVTYFALAERGETEPFETDRAHIESGEISTHLPRDARALIMLGCERFSSKQHECEEATLFAHEMDERKVAVEAFLIDKFEVTHGAYTRCVEEGGCETDDECSVYTHEGKQFGAKPPKSLEASNLPKICVSHENAAAFCKHRGGSLPTATQFLKAAREGTNRTFPWGDHWDPRNANWAERDELATPVLGAIDKFGFTAPPRSFDKGCTNKGVCDLSGNVAEWIRSDPPTHRGGSWTSSPFELRVTKAIEETRARTDVGFRCVYPHQP